MKHAIESGIKSAYSVVNSPRLAGWAVGFMCIMIGGLSWVDDYQPVEWIEPELVYVPEGPFVFGRSPHEKESFLTHSHEGDETTLYLPPFYIGRFEVTNDEYACFIRDAGYYRREFWSDGGWKARREQQWTMPRRWIDRHYHDERKGNFPVAAVSWYEAEAYCNWLSSKTGKPYRLPSEREWVKAARGAEPRIFPWGDEWNPKACNWYSASTELAKYRDQFIGTSPVGVLEEGRSPWGCYDMIGNVNEWCLDWWFDSVKQIEDRRYKVFKGGSYYTNYNHLLRISWRGGTYPDIGHVYWGEFGFRLAMDAGPDTD